MSRTHIAILPLHALLALIALSACNATASGPTTSSLRAAAEAGDAEAMNTWGAALEDGAGVMKNDREAADWYRKAAGKGNADAMRRLARLYVDGRGVQCDYGEAMKWARKSADG